MKIDRKELAAMLVYISDWCIEHRLGTGMIHNPPEEGSNGWHLRKWQLCQSADLYLRDNR